MLPAVALPVLPLAFMLVGLIIVVIIVAYFVKRWFFDKESWVSSMNQALPYQYKLRPGLTFSEYNKDSWLPHFDTDTK